MKETWWHQIPLSCSRSLLLVHSFSLHCGRKEHEIYLQSHCQRPHLQKPSSSKDNVPAASPARLYIWQKNPAMSVYMTEAPIHKCIFIRMFFFFPTETNLAGVKWKIGTSIGWDETHVWTNPILYQEKTWRAILNQTISTAKQWREEKWKTINTKTTMSGNWRDSNINKRNKKHPPCCWFESRRCHSHPENPPCSGGGKDTEKCSISK